jgi:putative tryptophan/tyrosine transport system substrate-binding protein
MRRREFVRFVAGGALMWPLSGVAQQPERKRKIGVLLGYASTADQPLARQVINLFQDALRRAGWFEGGNLSVEYRFGAGDPAKIDAAAAELVSLSPDAIYALGIPPAKALRQKTGSIPIVFSQVADPVGFGLVASLAHPGGNVTGFMTWDLTIGGKWVELLLEIAPGLKRVGVVYNPDTGPYAAGLIASAKVVAGATVAVLDLPVRDVRAIDAAATSLSGERESGLLVVPEPFTNTHQDEIIALSARGHLPAVVPFGGAARRGALLSYTYALASMIQEPVGYIDRILKGESPGDLPVQAPTKFELSINIDTAKALGLTAPLSLLGRADEVIE